MSKSIADLNKANSSFYGDREPTPGQRANPGPGAMLTSPMEAQEQDYPSESNMPEGKNITVMGQGQNVHSYLEPKNDDPLYRPNMGLEISPHDKSITQAGYSTPSVAGTFSEPKPSLQEINAKNKEYWEPHLCFEGEPSTLPENYPSEGPCVEPDDYGRN
jgi:hypothetical protein